jgi:hypothetical protein
MPRFTDFGASLLVKAWSAPFIAAWSLSCALFGISTIEPSLTIELPGVGCGRAALTMQGEPYMFVFNVRSRRLAEIPGVVLVLLVVGILDQEVGLQGTRGRDPVGRGP